LGKTAAECGIELRGNGLAQAAEISTTVRAKRPASYTIAEQRDELASSRCLRPTSDYTLIRLQLGPHQNRKVSRVKLAGGAALCAAEIPGGLVEPVVSQA
jgi:hypothetical protein